MALRFAFCALSFPAMNFLAGSNIFLLFSAVVVALAVASVAFFGLELGTDFTGGSILEVEYAGGRPPNQDVKERLAGLEIGLSYVQPIGEKGVVIRMKDLTEQVHQEVLAALGDDAKEMRFESIGPVIGEELKGKALKIALLSLGVIVLYIAFAFRRITQPVKFWQWSAAGFLALVHDVLVPLGVLALLGHVQGVQITIPVVVALLAVVGYSINDTVVVFDRIRENITKKVGADFQDTVRMSIRQTVSRSLNTSLTTLIAVLAIFFFGGESLKYFALVMILGIVAGTYSSLFLAPMLLVRWFGGAARSARPKKVRKIEA